MIAECQGALSHGGAIGYSQAFLCAVAGSFES